MSKIMTVKVEPDLAEEVQAVLDALNQGESATYGVSPVLAYLLTLGLGQHNANPDGMASLRQHLTGGKCRRRPR